jgi:hypothetical protein
MPDLDKLERAVAPYSTSIGTDCSPLGAAQSVDSNLLFPNWTARAKDLAAMAAASHAPLRSLIEVSVDPAAPRGFMIFSRACEN